jgi:Helix-turn-helix domain
VPDPDFIQIPYPVLRDAKISHAAKLVYGRLKLYAGKDGQCNPKHATLAREVCVAVRQLRNVLNELRKAGWIDWYRTRTSCWYTVHPDRQVSAEQDRQKIATQTGKNLPIRSAKNCQQKRSSENHHRRDVSEKKNARSLEEPTLVGPAENLISRTQNADDEKLGLEKTPIFASPVDELRDIHRRKTGAEITPDVERRIWETVELGGATRQQFIEQLRPHVPNHWKNPAGFLTNFARKFGAVSTPEPRPPTPSEPPKNAQGRCSVCGGTGYVHEHPDAATREHCSCQLGRDLKRVDERQRQPVDCGNEGAMESVQ